MRKKSNNDYVVGVFVIGVIVFALILWMLYYAVLAVKIWIEYNVWWVFLIFVLIFLILGGITWKLKRKSSNLVKDYSENLFSSKEKVEVLKQKIQQYEEIYPSLRNFNHNNDSSNLDYYQLKGQDGEIEVKSTLNEIIEANKLILFNNVFLKYGNELVQIDHIIVSDSCVFVIETKNWDIPTYANIVKKRWLQYHGNEKNFVASPVFQNYKHINVIGSLLKSKNIDNKQLKFYNIVVFVQNKLKLEENEVFKEHTKVLHINDLNSYILEKLNTFPTYSNEKDSLRNLVSRIILEHNTVETRVEHQEKLSY